jgi:hypothetical protein
MITGNPDLVNLGSGRSGSISRSDLNGSPAKNLEIAKLQAFRYLTVNSAPCLLVKTKIYVENL